MAGGQEGLTEGIDVNKLKEKYQQNRPTVDLTDALARNRETFEAENHALEENYRDFEAQKQEDLEADLPAEKKKQQGWGSWVGPGISQPKVDHEAEVRKKLARIEEIKRKRRDEEMNGVIVREAYNKNVVVL